VSSDWKQERRRVWRERVQACKDARAQLRGGRWHKRARHAMSHSLRLRLVTLFLLFALAMTGAFLFGMQKALGVGWRDAARPLVADYVDRLVTEIGSPPSVERAQALTRRLPVSVRISGPAVNWQSDPAPVTVPGATATWATTATRRCCSGPRPTATASSWA
jgi:hypothetical protein